MLNWTLNHENSCVQHRANQTKWVGTFLCLIGSCVRRCGCGCKNCDPCPPLWIALLVLLWSFCCLREKLWSSISKFLLVSQVFKNGYAFKDFIFLNNTRFNLKFMFQKSSSSLPFLDTPVSSTFYVYVDLLLRVDCHYFSLCLFSWENCPIPGFSLFFVNLFNFKMDKCKFKSIKISSTWSRQNQLKLVKAVKINVHLTQNEFYLI